MVQITRREFIRTSLAGTALVTLGRTFAKDEASLQTIGTTVLGKTGIEVSRLAIGTGTNGWGFESNQTRMGQAAFSEIARHAWECGINFFDTADAYGSHTIVKNVIKDLPRDQVVVMSKIWTSDTDFMTYRGAAVELDKIRKQLGIDHIDIVMLHCMTSGDWPSEKAQECEELETAKQKGIIRAHGVSCHSFEALHAAAASPWVDVVLARINHTGAMMDAKPERVMPVLKQAHERGAGVLGMKIFGCGRLTAPEQRRASMQYVWSSGNVDAMTIGYETVSHVDDAIALTNAVLKG
ncbi:MAG TPA: aldo/keto reductase [bacterium]|nr:aldo/keto reductase [bacterium]HPN42237.1 aldo/keto reductase [bacterium]